MLKTAFNVLILLILTCSHAVRAEGPALWAFEDEDTRIFLFGTIHALQKGTQWGTPTLKSAFDQSSAVILELSPEELAKAGPAMIAVGRLPNGQTLKSVLGDGLYSDMERAVRGAGLPRGSMDSARPWFAALSVGSISLVKAGIDPASGADKAFMTLATETGKPVFGLERASDQAAIFAGLEGEDERLFVIDTLTQMNDIKTHFLALQTAWVSGDTIALDRLINGSFSKIPALYDAALTQRNKKWTTTLVNQLNVPGVFFVAVGAGHLVGDMSVVTMVRANGINVARLQ